MKKILNWGFVLGLLAFFLAVPAGVLLWSGAETSAYYENRTLAARPDLNWETLWDGGYGSRFESWLSDHIPGRTTLLMADTRVQMNLLGRPVVNDVVVTEEVLLPKLGFGEYTEADYRLTAGPMADRFGKLNDHIEECGGVFRYVGFPEQRVYFQDRFPAYLNSHAAEADTADAVFAEALADRGVTFLDMRQVYAARGNPAAYYSAVDHHYNYYGAYAAYRAILEDLTAAGFDLPVLAEEDLEFQELPYPYIGSRNRKLYNRWENREKAVIAAQKEPVAFTRTDNGQPSERPLFVLPAADYLPTTYNLYMGGDFAETVLETHRPELPNVLIFGDSFTNALETLLYASFNETRILDLRHYEDMSLRDYITEHRPDIVLCIQNDTFYYTASGNGAVWED